MDEAGVFHVPLDSTRVSKRAFASVTALRRVVLHPGVLELDDGAFSHCGNLLSVDFASAKVTVGKSVFFKCHNLVSLENASNVQDIAKWAFFECKSLQSVSCSASYVDVGAFDTCTSLEDFSSAVPCAVGEHAFFKCSSLKKMENLTAISNNSFSNCSELRYVKTLPAATSVGEMAFSGCSKLTSVKMVNVAELHRGAFHGCTGLVQLKFPKLETVGSHAFALCTKLSTIFLPVVHTIKDEAFYMCKDLAHISMDELLIVGDRCFAMCRYLQTVSFPKVYALGSGAFRGDVLLETVFLPSLQKLQKETFVQCINLHTAILPGMRDIGSKCFAETESLHEFPEMPHLETIRTKAFEHSGLKEVATAARMIFDFAFSKASGLKRVVLRPGVEMIGSACFRNTPVEHAVFPDTVRIVGDFVVSHCPNLKSITMAEHPPPSGRLTLMPYSFNGVQVQAVSGPERLFRRLQMPFLRAPTMQLKQYVWSIKWYKENNPSDMMQAVVYTVYACFCRLNVAPEMAMVTLQMLLVSQMGKSWY